MTAGPLCAGGASRRPGACRMVLLALLGRDAGIDPLRFVSRRPWSAVAGTALLSRVFTVPEGKSEVTASIAVARRRNVGDEFEKNCHQV